MALQFQNRAAEPVPGRVALFPGAWNPPTVAHLAVARAAASQWADEVIWVLPRAFPHKDFDGAGFAQRLETIMNLTEREPRHSVAVAEGGLFAEIAEEARAFFGPKPEIGLLCGRDAAERIAAWDYGAPGVFERMIAQYPLLVAARSGAYAPAAAHEPFIVTLPMDAEFRDVSSTEVRRRIASGEPWRHLVPEPAASAITRSFSSA